MFSVKYMVLNLEEWREAESSRFVKMITKSLKYLGSLFIS